MQHLSAEAFPEQDPGSSENSPETPSVSPASSTGNAATSTERSSAKPPVSARKIQAKRPNSLSSTKVRKSKVVWPNQRRWTEEFSQRVQANETAKAAYKKLIRGGCIPGNLMSFVYNYTCSPTTVFQQHSRMRDEALDGLKGVAGRVDRAAVALQELFDSEWWNEPTFGIFLEKRCRFDLLATSRTGTVIRGKVAPVSALHLPNVLRHFSADLNQLRQELRKTLTARKVSRTIYLVEFAVYIEAVTQRPIPWTVLAELVNAAQPEHWKEKQVDPTLLQKNFKSFTRRNEELYRQIRADIAAYVDTCAQLPEKERPTLVGWTLKRRTADQQPS